MYSRVFLNKPSGIYLIIDRFFNLKPVLFCSNYVSTYYGNNYNNNHNSELRMIVLARPAAIYPTRHDKVEWVLSFIVSSHNLTTTSNDRITNKRLFVCCSCND
jgi:hypothetical protein